MEILDWNKCGDSKAWCSFDKLNLAHDHFNNMEGVYVIWHSGQTPKTVRVGQGVIKDRLAAHRQDKEIAAYSQHGLFVTWARVSEAQRGGVEAYLAAQLNPVVGERFPDVRQIAVNLPW